MCQNRIENVFTRKESGNHQARWSEGKPHMPKPEEQKTKCIRITGKHNRVQA
jgi:hypothetical protein